MVLRREVVGQCFSRAVLLLGQAKKLYFGSHNFEGPSGVVGHTHQSLVYAHLSFIALKLSLIDKDVEATWAKNIGKLRDRYEGGAFDPDLSQNRD